MNERKRIMYSGGGSGGSVSPLLAVHEELVSEGGDDLDFYWVGTKHGPEREMVLKESIPFKAICSGKFRRYFSFKNVVDPFWVLVGFFQSLFFFIKFKPDVLLTAGGFVAVPVSLAAWVCGVRVLVHQQDVRVGLANRIIARVAFKITVTFKESVADFSKKSVLTGNAVRKVGVCGDLEVGRVRERYGFQNELPVLLVLGGGTGASGINELLKKSTGELSRVCNVLHVAGKGKELAANSSYYYGVEFLNKDELSDAYGISDVVVSRAGMGTLSELSRLRKASIVIPMPNSHQEENAEVLKAGGASIILSQGDVSVVDFVGEVEGLMRDGNKRGRLEESISKVIKTDGVFEIIKIVKRILNGF